MEFENKNSGITVVSPPPAPPLPPPPTINPIPTGQGRNQLLYERHVTKSGRNRGNYPLIMNQKKTEYQPKPLFNQKTFMEKYSDKDSLVAKSKQLFDEWKSNSDSHQRILR